ncbi:aminoacyl-tRNA hydrolase [Tomitella biformata]|uniref:aminoacyl-tRNA hydrolase n=1 Tax=Tomitella biformata TaxID=630403 RepID=UPI0004656F67|nr:peptidyl-tRNA hydrolase [Tomitella biformata]
MGIFDWLRRSEPQDSVNEFAARHKWLAGGYGNSEDPADPSQVLAMQLVLHIEKKDPPRRSDVLAAAASSAVALCLDERCGPGGGWEQEFKAWSGARIRKVSRRARGIAWDAAQELPGVTIQSDGAEARAYVPGKVGELEQRLRKLQINGTDLVDDEPGEPDAAYPVLWLQAELGMTVGKAAAQVGHASMLLAGAMKVDQVQAWAESGFRCSVRDAGAEQWAGLAKLVRAGKAIAVRDAGFTEVAAGSMTVIAVPGK